MSARRLLVAFLAMPFSWLTAGAAHAQAPAPPESPWSADVSIGWDNSVSGDFLTGAIGTLQGAPVAIEKKTWDDVYGTGLMLNLAVGYSLNELSELRGSFTFQSTGADDTVSIGSYRAGPLLATFDTYKAWSLDAGYRRYFSEAVERWRPYAGASLGIGHVSAIPVTLAQTAVGFVANDVDFYGGNAALTFGLNGGTLYRVTDRVWIDARLALRYVSGLSEVKGSSFTALDDLNDGSSRWTLPLIVGIKTRF